MKQFLKENWFKIIIAFIILLIGFSVFYYLVYFIPQKEKTIMEQQKQEQIFFCLYRKKNLEGEEYTAIPLSFVDKHCTIKFK